MRIVLAVLPLTAALFILSACGNLPKGEAKYPTGADRASTGGANNIYNKPQSIFGEGGLKILGGDKKTQNVDGIAVNGLLWRASLDTISFMPIASADPFGGTIITDWYSSPDAPEERFKVNIFILGRELRADGVRVAMFRQTRGRNAGWQDAAVDPAAARALEDAILTRARELRIASQANKD